MGRRLTRLLAYEHLSNRVCHRDISLGNIMITFDKATKTRGWLIDLDRAKYDENHERMTIAESMVNGPPAVNEEGRSRDRLFAAISENARTCHARPSPCALSHLGFGD